MEENKRLSTWVLGQLPMRTIPHQIKIKPNHCPPVLTTIPRTIPHQDNSPQGPLPQNKNTHQDQNLHGGQLSSWGVVQIRSTRSGYCQRCACVVCMTNAISWPNCVFAVAKIQNEVHCLKKDNHFHEIWDWIFSVWMNSNCEPMLCPNGSCPNVLGILIANVGQIN